MKTSLRGLLMLSFIFGSQALSAQYSGGNGRGDHLVEVCGLQLSFCVNPISGGEIASNQTICYGSSPETFIGVVSPTGHTGTLEYRWQISTSSPTFVEITSAVSETYTHTGIVTQTTWFRRLARVTCETDWVPSNVLQVDVEPLPITGQLQKHPNQPSVEMGATVSATLTPGTGGNLTDELQYRTHNGTSWSNWVNYTSGDAIPSFRKTQIEVQTKRKADYCLPAGIVSVSWDVESTSVTNQDKGFVYYFIQDAVNVASPGHTICIGTNTYEESVDTSGRGGLILQAGCSQGTVTVTGTFILSAGDLLEMELFGDDDYDKFIIQDEASITGASLVIKLVGGYKPEAGKRFIIFTSPNYPGTFSNPPLFKTSNTHFVITNNYNEVEEKWELTLNSVTPVFKMEIKTSGQ